MRDELPLAKLKTIVRCHLEKDGIRDAPFMDLRLPQRGQISGNDWGISERVPARHRNINNCEGYEYREAHVTDALINDEAIDLSMSCKRLDSESEGVP